MLSYIFNWTLLWWILLCIYLPACIGLIIVVLLQKGKGVGFAGAFGAGGGSEAVFGPRTSRSLPQKLTYTMAGLFLFLALVMSVLAGKVGKGAAPALVAGESIEAQPTEQMNELFEGDAAVEAPAAETTTTVSVVESETTTPVTVVDSEAAAPATVETPAPVVDAPVADVPVVVNEAPATEAPVVVEEAPATEPAPAAQ